MDAANDLVLAQVHEIYGILSPHIVEAGQRLRSGETRLVHYTTSANALNIINSEQFWLRNVRCMNDYSEVQHGLNLLIHAFNENEGLRRERFLAAFGQSRSAAEAAIKKFDELIPSLPIDTFIGCLSEHDEAATAGRLSMWRAYCGRDGGVAIFMNSAPFLSEADELKAYSTPVLYLSDEEFKASLDQTIERLEQAKEIIGALSTEVLEHLVFWWLTFHAVSLKHPAFSEEREWRVVYIPTLERSNHIIDEVETLSGMPQIVQKIPLLNDESKGLSKADLDDLIHRIVIGPSQYPMVIRDALDRALSDKAVKAPWDRIFMSLIPLRT